MDSTELLVDAYGRIRDEVRAVVTGLTAEDLAARPTHGANSISWLVWHLTRVQDDHIADAAGTGQVWTAEGWAGRFALDLPITDTGYGHDEQQAAKVRVDSPDLLLGYHDAVHERTVTYLRGLTASDLDRVVDENWSPPVTLGVRLISVLADDLQHVGQAAYVRGLSPRT